MSEEKEEKLEAVREQNQQIQDLGEAMLEENEKKYHIQLLTIIGEVEGHECLPNNSKTTKYEHILPKLAVIEDSRETDGLLILLNTVGGDVEAGLVRSSGMFIGVMQTYRNMEKIQDRITRFIAGHSHMKRERIEELMLDTSQLVKDVGTMLEGEEAVKEGLIDETGGIQEAMEKLYELIEKRKNIC